MKMWFHVRSAGAIVRFRRNAIVRMVLVSAVGAVWMLASGVWFVGTWRSIQAEQRKVRIELFLMHDLADTSARSVVRALNNRKEIRLAWLVHEQQVWQEFSNEVGGADNLRAVVHLPRIVRATLHDHVINTSAMNTLATQLAMDFAGRCTEVAWPRALVRTLDGRRSDVVVMGAICGLLSLALFLVTLAYAFRAELQQSANDLHAGAIIGLGAGSLAMPHLFVSACCGILGLSTGLGIVYVAREYLRYQFDWLQFVYDADVWIMFAVLCVAGGLLSVYQALRAGAVALKVRRPR